jgi:hypothetical protein
MDLFRAILGSCRAAFLEIYNMVELSEGESDSSSYLNPPNFIQWEIKTQSCFFTFDKGYSFTITSSSSPSVEQLYRHLVMSNV